MSKSEQSLNSFLLKFSNTSDETTLSSIHLGECIQRRNLYLVINVISAQVRTNADLVFHHSQDIPVLQSDLTVFLVRLFFTCCF